MAALGTVILRDDPPKAPFLPIANYQVVRGNYLGAIASRDPAIPLGYQRRATLTEYTVRQLRVIFRQLWPPYGQRFPQ